MVIVNEDSETKLVSDKQKDLYMKLLESSHFTKTERDNIVNSVLPKIITTYDASVFIDFVILKLRYQKYFFGVRKHKISQCANCKTKINLQRFLDMQTNKKLWLCGFCKVSVDASKIVPVKIAESNEVKADLIRKDSSSELTFAQEDLIIEHREQ